MLGSRESSHYGNDTLKNIEDEVINKAKESNFEIIPFQSNIEGEICTIIQKNLDVSGIIINAGAYTHTSIAILDSLNVIKNINPKVIIVEVHLSHMHKREEFRHYSYISQVSDASIFGMKKHGYLYALDFITNNN
ncbi:unnamed protein product [Rotaria magnacalcarata]|uniref:3-dehydroquinate dehydratase n=1 Tax=Rotaria magnacalcarata TaxID=392030 RepID=A0A816BWW4_9BILA|nr:unnamed protein product [Rotaria magnacalcarata]